MRLVSPQGATGRADLLRALAVADRSSLMIDSDGQHWFGYRRRETPPAAQTPAAIGSIAIPVEIRVTESARRVPLKMQVLPHALVERQPRAHPKDEERPDKAARPAEPLDEEGGKALSSVRRVGYEDLVPEARLLPALRRQLGSVRAGTLDLRRLVEHLAARRFPRHLPRRVMQRWHPELVVVLDFCERLWPYREDMHRLAERLLQRCGRSGLSLRIFNQGPDGAWRDWLAEQNPHALTESPARSWAPLPPGTPVLIASDLGLLLGARSATAAAWRSFVRRLLKSDLKPLALLPLGADQLDGGLPGGLTILRWSPDARPRPERARGSGHPVPDGLANLLAMAAATRRVDPPLLRALRRINPRAPLNAGLEGALWCHADVEAGSAAAVRKEVRDKHLRRFTSLVTADQLRVERLRFDHHAHLRAALMHQETLAWRANASAAAGDLPFEVTQRIDAAERFVERLAASLQQSGPTSDQATWLNVARDLVLGADAHFGSRYSELLTPLVASLSRIQGGLAMIPSWVDPATLARLAGEEQDRAECWLVLDPVRQGLVLQAGPAIGNQISFSAPLVLEGGARVTVGRDTAKRKRWFSCRDLPALLADLGLAEPLVLETARETINLVPIQRPRGAMSWSVNRVGFRVSSAPLGETQMDWLPEELPATKSIELPNGQVIWTLYTGITTRELGSHALVRFQIDPVYGVKATLHIDASHGRATQSFRWIEPGTFTMGSPADEPQRDSDEGPAHPVTLSRGFWLADTSCTQAFWQAVMGENPSHFTGDDQRPVEQGSWNSVQDFLRKLEALLPSCKADLPTEAEWEYACRAGTDTPFSFGANITPEQVNYNGNGPYAGGEEGLYRQQTVPVGSLPPNPWGLYEMHGNVWEWCADGPRDYDGAPQVDPMGPVIEGDNARRAVRGGSWFDGAGWSRSASRFALHPGIAGNALGLRLCLRSIGPGQAAGRTGGPAEAAPGGSAPPVAPPRDEAATPESWWDRIKKKVRPGRSGRGNPDERS